MARCWTRCGFGVLSHVTFQKEGGDFLAALDLDGRCLVASSTKDIRVVVENGFNGVGVLTVACYLVIKEVQTAPFYEALPRLVGFP
jgi:hypothetical protein